MTRLAIAVAYRMRWLEKHFGKFAVPHLTLAMIILTAVVTGADLAFELGIGSVSLESVLGGQWWHIFFYPFRISVGDFFGFGPWIPLFVFLYVYWLFGSQLEILMGDFRYNLYILLGVLFTLLGSPFGVSAEFIYLGVFLGVATLNPNMQILLFFIIPVRIKWVAIFIVATILFNPLVALVFYQEFWPILGPALGFLNYLIFFGPGLWKRRAAQPVRQAKFRASSEPPAPTAIHRCTVCGQTELDDPRLEFRFCVDCTDHEYCQNHLFNHEHI